MFFGIRKDGIFQVQLPLIYNSEIARKPQQTVKRHSLKPHSTLD